MRRGRAFEKDADDRGDVVFVFRIFAELLPDWIGAETAPMFFVFFFVLARNHVGEVWHLRSENSLGEENGREADFFHDGNFAGVEHFDFVDALGFVVTGVGAKFENPGLLVGAGGREFEMFHAFHGEEQGAIETNVGRIVFGDGHEFFGGFLVGGVGCESGGDVGELVEGIERDQDVNFVGGRIFDWREDADGFDAHAIVGGDGGVLPVIGDLLLLFLGLGGVNAEFVILASVIRGGGGNEQ